MALREEIERSGNWLFRWRSYLPLVLIPPQMIAFAVSNYRDGLVWGIPAACFQAFGLLVSILGLMIRCITAGMVPAGTSGRNVSGQEARYLNTSGVYSLVRHPLYLGNSLMILGVSLFVGTWWLPLYTILILWLYYERIMFAEEEFLRRKFGDTYLQWADRTPAIFPSLRRWKRPHLAFSCRTMVRREYSGLFGLVSAFTVLDVFERGMEGGIWHAASPWLLFFAATLLFYLTMVFLQKKTRLLRVEGR